MRIDHVGYAVSDIRTAKAAFSELGYVVCGESVEDRGRNVEICFLRDPSGMKVELIAPLGENSPVSGWLRKNGPSPYHICYESENLEADIAVLKGRGFMPVQPPSPAPAMDNRKVCFMYAGDVGLIEPAENGKEFSE